MASLLFLSLPRCHCLFFFPYFPHSHSLSRSVSARMLSPAGEEEDDVLGLSHDFCW